MKAVTSVLTVAAVASLTLPAQAEAQLSLSDPFHSCEYLTALSAFNPDAAACIGAYEGNEANAEGEADALALIAAAGWGNATSLGTTELDGPNSGWLSFAPSLTGDYILALKSSTYVSFYRFLGLNGVSQIYYTTQGTSLNGRGTPQGLSHYTLYSTRTVSVPEPESAALLLTGLIGLGFVATRRRRDNVA
jgi:hypothetical protein